VRSRFNVFLVCLLAVQILVIIVLDKPWTSGYARREPATEAESFLFPGYSKEKARKVTVTQGGMEITLAWKSADEWVVEDAKSYRADMNWVDRLLESLAIAKRSDVVSDNPDKWTNYEVDEESGFRLQVWNDEGTSVVDAVIGKVMGPLKGTYVRMTGSNEVVLVMEYLRRHVNKGRSQANWLRAWREKAIHHYKQKNATSLKIEGKHGLLTFERRSGGENDADTWFMTQPFQGEVSAMLMSQMLGVLCGLTAQGFMPPDTKPEDVGLDAPTMVLTLGKEDGEPVVFRVSREGEEGKEKHLRWLTASCEPGEIFKVPASFFFYFGNKPESYLKKDDE